VTVRKELTGGWVELRSAEDLTEREARKLRAAARAAFEAAAKALAEGLDESDPATWGAIEDDENGATPFELYQDSLIATFVVSWSWEGSPADAADLLPAKTFADLVAACNDINSEATPDFGVDGATDPKVPTDG